MGAGGSTAASCSSLDYNARSQRARLSANVAANGYPLPPEVCGLSAHKQMHASPNRLQHYGKKPAANNHRKSANMKQYSSHFDLTSDQILLNHGDQMANRSQVQLRKQPDRTWLDTGQPEVYTLSNADVGLVQPIMVLPGDQVSSQRHSLANHQQLGAQAANKSSPVVSKIQQRQQQARLNDLKKLSDSLPSLNNIQISARMSDRVHGCHQHASVSPCCRERNNTKSLAQQQVCHPKYRKEQLARHQQQQVAIKRATSLSNLHNQHQLDERLAPCELPRSQYAQCQSKQQSHYGSPASQPHLYHQPTSVAKKISKFRQVSAQAGSQLASVAKKYRRKQAPVKQSSVQQQQQGCQVLPPLPRSQSLHELIQLRATENGQRMRTTGTLRTSAAQSNQDSKVNLVAEILESRRQRQLDQTNLRRHTGSASSSRLSSSSSSTDDGIHDVSIGVYGDQSTGGSRALNLERHKSQSSNRRDSKSPQLDRPASQMLNNDLPSTRGPNASTVGNSTLKRSLSHSALHQHASGSLLDDDFDEDASEDLSELAKFLYQFKQRQKAHQVANADSNVSAELDRGEPRDKAAAAAAAEEENGNQQQSPNSTTSSSGFASSSCATNSISSAGSHKKTQEPARLPSRATGSKLVSSRKKYPAPSRPGQLAPLRSAPSLLSIVDESRCLSTGEQPDLHIHHGQAISQLEQLERYTQIRQMSQSELALNHLISSSVCEPQAVKGSTGRRSASAKQERNEHKRQSKGDLSANKAYKSRLINLIRRISDKPAEVSPDGSYQSSVGGREPGESVRAADSLDRFSWQPINQSESIVPPPPARSNCQPSGRAGESEACDLERLHPAAPDKRLGRRASDRAGESVCDLNFDCDFELVKRCGTGSTETKPGPIDKPGVGSSLLLSNQVAKSSCLSPTCCSRESSKVLVPVVAASTPPLPPDGCSAQRRLQQQRPINSQSKGENNWQLVAAPASQQPPSKLAMQASDGRHKLQAACQSVAGQQSEAQQAGKLKWSAGNWLANRRDSSSKALKGKNKQLMTTTTTAAPSSSGKSYLAKLIPSSRTSACKQAAAGRSSEQQLSDAARVNNEANQLLDELDHSLDMVSASSPFSRKAAVSWWKSAGEPASRVKLGSLNASDNSDADEPDDDHYGALYRAHLAGYQSSECEESDDYANFNLALINATFDAAEILAEHKLKQQRLTSQKSCSPSDSFTFSQPASPAAREFGQADQPKIGREQKRKLDNHTPLGTPGHRSSPATQRDQQTKAGQLVLGAASNNNNNNFYLDRCGGLSGKLDVKELCAKHEQEMVCNKQQSFVAPERTSGRVCDRSVNGKPVGSKQVEPDTSRLISNALEQVASLVCKTTNGDQHDCRDGLLDDTERAGTNNRLVRSLDSKGCQSASNLGQVSCCGVHRCQPAGSQVGVSAAELRVPPTQASQSCGCREDFSCNRVAASCSSRPTHGRQERGGFSGEVLSGSNSRTRDDHDDVAVIRSCRDGSCCSAKRLIRMQQQQQQQHLKAPKCKLVPIQKLSPPCQLHSSSKQSRTHHNEDVKSGVSRDNPIGKEGGHHDADSSDRVAVAGRLACLASSTNCCRAASQPTAPASCCSSAGSSVMQPQNLQPQNLQRSSRLYSHGQVAEPGAGLTAAPATHLNRALLSGAPKLISIKNKLVSQTPGIYRSNSELTSTKFSPVVSRSVGGAGGGGDQLLKLDAKQVDEQLSAGNRPARLLLNGRNNDTSLEISQNLGSTRLLTSYASSSNLLNADFDDNFILRRKTPNAGLRSRC